MPPSCPLQTCWKGQEQGKSHQGPQCDAGPTWLPDEKGERRLWQGPDILQSSVLLSMPALITCHHLYHHRKHHQCCCGHYHFPRRAIKKCGFGSICNNLKQIGLCAYCNNSWHKRITRKCLLQREPDSLKEIQREIQREFKKVIERTPPTLFMAFYGFIWLSISLWLPDGTTSS